MMIITAKNGGKRKIDDIALVASNHMGANNFLAVVVRTILILLKRRN